MEFSTKRNIQIIILILCLACVYSSYSSRSRRSARYQPVSASRGYSMYKPSPSRYRYSQSRSGDGEYPGGTARRTMYTGRYCAYPVTKKVPKKVPNGTETYLKQVYTQCHWTALYCNPRPSYVTATRQKYKTIMSEVRREEWRCCPGFHGPSCDETCYNCTTMTDMTERLEQLEIQVLDGSFIPGTGGSPIRPGPSRPGPKGEPGVAGPVGLPGPTGPRGAAGRPGPVGSPGKNGARGEKGMTGLPGIAGMDGMHGLKGETGDKGEPGKLGETGSRGEKGDTGMPGLPGLSGEPGAQGPRGERGEDGLTGLQGPTGPLGKRGPAGENGMKGDTGDRGERGLPGRPGPPGECGCPENPPPEEQVLPTENPGSSACFYEGKYYSENELWSNEDCEECLCLDGMVTCLLIVCPNKPCKYTYKPEGYCCPICCPNQKVGNGDESSGDEAYDDDGAMETIHASYAEYSNDSLAYETYEEEEEEVNIISDSFDPLGCPIAIPDMRRSQMIDSRRCLLRKDPGPCRGKYHRYFFDKVRQQCSVFIFGGCEGNSNSFLTEKECLQTCVRAEIIPNTESAPESIREKPSQPTSGEISICYDAPAVRGPCKAMFPRFSYEPGTGRCHVFLYGGCDGSRNTFESPEDCKEECKAGDPVYPGITTLEGFIETPPTTEPLPPAEINVLDRFDELPRRCRQQKVVGKCRASLPRFYYDAEEDRCKLFVFGGCGGNGNNFVTPWECADKCGGKTPAYEQVPETDRCFLSKEIGTCRASHTRYYYDKDEQLCKKFVYGGCRGNANNFLTRDDCTEACRGAQPPAVERTVTSRMLGGASLQLPEVCYEAMEPGPCRGLSYRFFYDSTTERCSIFIYGGCLGNNNNFATPEECQKACSRRKTNYTITYPNEQTAVRGERGPPGPRGERGPPGLSGMGFAGVPGPPGPPGPAGSDATSEYNATEVKALRDEIEILKSRVTELASTILTHVVQLDRHVDPTRKESSDRDGIPSLNEDIFNSLIPHGSLKPVPVDGEEPTDADYKPLGVDYLLNNIFNYGDYGEEEEE